MKMIKQRDFRRFQVAYHRNGISGDGFCLCRFLFLRGKATVEMQAVVFEEKGKIAITSENINQRWRSDDFEPAIRAAIKAVEAAQPETMHHPAEDAVRHD